MAEKQLKIGVLDQSPVPEGFTPGDALRNSLDLAKLADQLGFHRYWLAEHHGTPGLACASPEVMISAVSQATSRIRVGSGGVMLPHYSPLKVAETFSMLEGLAPGRIDLGIGRAAGTSQRVAHALQRDRRQPPLDDFREHLEELLRYFAPVINATSHFPVVPATQFRSPECWLLGSSPQSAIWAAELGLPYCFADFINPGGAPFADYYRREFQASATVAKPVDEEWEGPHMAVCVWAICADTEEEALELSLSWRMLITLLFRGRLIQVPKIEHARQFLKEEKVPLAMLPAGRRAIAGTPDKVRAAIEAVAAQYGADEALVLNIVHDHQARRRSYELLAKAFELTPQA
jgi:luciferase family oxidoreductase group 1